MHKHNTLVAENSAVAAYPDVAGKLLGESSYNLVSNGSGMAGVTDGSQGNLVGAIASLIDAMLGELDYHGGSVQTVPLRVDSPALDAGSAEWATSQIGSSATISYDLLGGVIRGGVVFLETVDTTFPAPQPPAELDGQHLGQQSDGPEWLETAKPDEIGGSIEDGSAEDLPSPQVVARSRKKSRRRVVATAGASSFYAEGKGLEPSTDKSAPDFESGC